MEQLKIFFVGLTFLFIIWVAIASLEAILSIPVLTTTLQETNKILKERL